MAKSNEARLTIADVVDFAPGEFLGLLQGFDGAESLELEMQRKGKGRYRDQAEPPEFFRSASALLVEGAVVREAQLLTRQRRADDLRRSPIDLASQGGTATARILSESAIRRANESRYLDRQGLSKLGRIAIGSIMAAEPSLISRNL